MYLIHGAYIMLFTAQRLGEFTFQYCEDTGLRRQRFSKCTNALESNEGATLEVP